MLDPVIEFLKHHSAVLGYSIIGGMIFAESGLLIGFFFPGDSLLFIAGVLAAQGYFDISILVIICFVAAVLGDNVGYTFGHKVGKKLFTKEKSLLFHPDHIVRARAFYEKHGKKTIILARFLPAVRTFAPIVAGVGSMHYKTFLLFNVVGAFLWAVCIPLIGYFLGNLIPKDKFEVYIIGIVLLIVGITTIPQLYHILKEKKRREQLFVLIKNIFGK